MELYAIDLFSKHININSNNYLTLMQACIKTGENTYINILILKDINLKEYLITSIDFNKKIIMPIPPIMINKIFKSLKSLSHIEEVENIINKINYKYDKKDSKSQKPKKINIIENIYIYIQSSIQIGRFFTLNIEFANNIKLLPVDFIFIAYNGIDHRLCYNINIYDSIKIKNWHAYSGIKIFINNALYGNFSMEKIINNNDFLQFHCANLLITKLKSKTTGSMKFKNIDPINITNYMISMSGLHNVVAFPPEYNNNNNWYTIIIGIEGLIIDEEFGIGNVEFFKKTNDEIKRIIKFHDIHDIYETFASVHVNNTKLYNAAIIGKNQIEQSINLLNIIIKDDSIYNIHSTGETILSRNISTFEKKFFLSSSIYIESPLTNSVLSGNAIDIEKEPLIITKESIDSYNELLNIEMLLIKNNGKNDENITPLFNSLKWIKKAWDTPDIDDKIIYSIIALEFVVSKEKNNEMISKNIRKLCKSEIDNIIKQNYENIDNVSDYIKKINEKFDRTFTETPFMEKLRNLVKQLNIPISNEEFNLISKIRSMRNNIIHGKYEFNTDIEQIYHLCEIISTIVFYKLKDFTV